MLPSYLCRNSETIVLPRISFRLPAGEISDKIRNREQFHGSGGDFRKCGKEVRDMLPKDPIMLLSFVNLKLRDFYGSLDAMCEDMDADRQEIEDRLAGAGYHYDSERNQFV